MMQLKIKVFALFLSLIFGCFAFSQNQLSSQEVVDFKIKAENASANLNSIKSNFKQTKHLNLLENEVVSSGELYYKRPNLVKWTYLKPSNLSNILKGETLFVLENGKAKKIDLNSNKLIKNMNILVSNSAEGKMFDESMFTITYFENPSAYKVKFVPKDKKMKRFFEAFELYFNKDNYIVNGLILKEVNGDSTEIQFENMQLNTHLPESIFSVE